MGPKLYNKLPQGLRRENIKILNYCYYLNKKNNSVAYNKDLK